MSDLMSPRAKRHAKRIFWSLLAVVVVLVVLLLVLTYVKVKSGQLTLLSLSIAIVSIFIAILSYTRPQRWFPDDVRFRILNSEPKDWEYQETSFEEGSRYVYKKNRELVLQYEPYDTDDEFVEPWVKKYPNSIARRQVLDVQFSGQRYDRIPIIQVDEGRKPVPLPTPEDHTITPYEKKVGEIVHCSRAEGMRPDVDELRERYEQALETGGVKVSQ